MPKGGKTKDKIDQKLKKTAINKPHKSLTQSTPKAKVGSSPKQTKVSKEKASDGKHRKG